MTREEMLACLNGRPCDVCNYHTENGCKRWNCVFEEEPDDAENKGEWIPVSERLPDELESVNITWINRNPESYYADIKDKPFTATGVYFNGQWYWWTPVCTDILAEYSHNYDAVIDDGIEIIAWQPLPKPYKADMRGDNNV